MLHRVKRLLSTKMLVFMVLLVSTTIRKIISKITKTDNLIISNLVEVSDEQTDKVHVI